MKALNLQVKWAKLESSILSSRPPPKKTNTIFVFLFVDGSSESSDANIPGVIRYQRNGMVLWETLDG